MGIASPVIQCSSFSSDAHIWTPHLQHPIVTLHNGFNVSVVMRRKSISVIDHLKCGPLFQQRNVLAQRWNILTYSSQHPRPLQRVLVRRFWSHIHLICVLLSLLNFQGFFTFPIILLSVHPHLCLCILFPQLYPFLLFPCTSQKTSTLCQYPVTQWGGLGPDRRTKGKD